MQNIPQQFSGSDCGVFVMQVCTCIMYDSKKILILKKGIGIEGEKIIETS